MAARRGKPALSVKRATPSEFSKSEKQYFRDLHKLIDDIYKQAHEVNGWTWNQLAGEASLASLTVTNLGNRLTKYPQFMTVWKLAKAVGWEIKLVQSNAGRSVKTVRKAA